MLTLPPPQLCVDSYSLLIDSWMYNLYIAIAISIIIINTITYLIELTTCVHSFMTISSYSSPYYLM